MKKPITNSKAGFTIIEVVLVLGIAGLIFLMVFVAYPMLSRNNRDTSRRNHFSAFLAKVQSYQSNNRNAIPTITSTTASVTGQLNANKNSLSPTSSNGWIAFYRDYLLSETDDFADPDGSPYNLRIVSCGSTAPGTECNNSYAQNFSSKSFPNNHELTIVMNATCNGQTAVASSGVRQIAALYKFEGGGSYCGNN